MRKIANTDGGSPDRARSDQPCLGVAAKEFPHRNHCLGLGQAHAEAVMNTPPESQTGRLRTPWIEDVRIRAAAHPGWPGFRIAPGGPDHQPDPHPSRQIDIPE